MIILTGDRMGKDATLNVGCAAVIFDSPKREKILLTRRTDNGRWCLPGGRMEPGESASEACEREVREETGLEVTATKLVGVYTSPDRVITYANHRDKLLHLVAMCFEAEVVGGSLSLSNETTEFGWFTRDEIAGLDVIEIHPQRIADAFANRAEAFMR